MRVNEWYQMCGKLVDLFKYCVVISCHHYTFVISSSYSIKTRNTDICIDTDMCQKRYLKTTTERLYYKWMIWICIFTKMRKIERLKIKIAVHQTVIFVTNYSQQNDFSLIYSITFTMYIIGSGFFLEVLGILEVTVNASVDRSLCLYVGEQGKEPNNVVSVIGSWWLLLLLMN